MPLDHAIAARRRLRLADGRVLTYRVMGAADGSAVLALHGTPGSSLKFVTAHDTALRLGVRLIAPDRWGYGGSEPPLCPDLCQYGGDLSQLADACGVRRFALLGVSGGGPFATAAASRLGDRIMRLALVGPVGPLADGLSGVGLFHRVSFMALPRVPGAVRGMFAMFRALAMVSPGLAMQIAVSRAGAADRALMRRREISGPLAASFREGMAGGVTGPVIDMGLFRRWSIGSATAMCSAAGHPRSPACQVRVWLGTSDRNVPLAAARRLGRILGAEITELEGCGHYWLAADCTDVLGWCVAGAR